MLEYLNAAIMIEPKGIYYYMLACIKYDYFHRKYLNILLNHIDDRDTASEAEYPKTIFGNFFSILNVEKPEVM
jgi:hypothetical protein